MKRLIKYHSTYKEIQFSNCSTEYELYPIVVDDNAGEKELKKYAKELGLTTKGKAIDLKISTRWRSSLQVSHAIKLNETIERTTFNKKETYPVYLGFISISDSTALPLHTGLDKAVTKEQAWEIVNSQSYGVDNQAKIDGSPAIVMGGWEYYHEIKVRGYSLKSFEKRMGLTKDSENLYFSDSVNSCGECGEWDHNDDGYHTNFRILDGDFVGVNCGCYSKLSKEQIGSFVNNTDSPMELNTANELESEGKIEFLERFIGGMTDGRGGSFAGVRIRGGSPVGVLEEYSAKFPKAKFIFTHDESGQFQTYFSIWKVKTKALSNVG